MMHESVEEADMSQLHDLGWDEGITGKAGDPAMTVGERSLLVLSPYVFCLSLS